ncbi:MAG: hypothetical protein VX335_05210 [Pseudomonadota bacterium]|nr:hypothetical protein [Pseudomonadota bacterium]
MLNLLQQKYSPLQNIGADVIFSIACFVIIFLLVLSSSFILHTILATSLTVHNVVILGIIYTTNIIIDYLFNPKIFEIYLVNTVEMILFLAIFYISVNFGASPLVSANFHQLSAISIALTVNTAIKIIMVLSLYSYDKSREKPTKRNIKNEDKMAWEYGGSCKNSSSLFTPKPQYRISSNPRFDSFGSISLKTPKHQIYTGSISPFPDITF